jgi:APA family basic amino acid/polyamine antiporter
MQQKLQRGLGLPLLTLYGLGNILGAGIYVLVGKVTEASAGAGPLAFVVAAGVAGLTAFSYMELSSRYPLSAGASMYAYEGFKKIFLSRIVGLLMVLTGVVSSATLAHGFAGYARDFLALDKHIFIVLIMVALGLIAAWGIKESARLAAVFTLIEVAGLLAIVWLGRHAVAEPGSMQHVFSFGDLGLAGVFAGAFLAFYAYIGFEDMVNVAEEAERPRRNMPLAILFSLVASTILYMLVVIVASKVVPAHDLATSGSPLSLVFSSLSTFNPLVISAIGLAATVNGILVNLIMASRMLYGMADRQWLPEWLSKVNPRTKTPLNATLLVVGVMLVAAMLLPLLSLAQATSYLVLAVFTLVNGALIVVKLRRQPAVGVFGVPLAVPILAALCCIGLIAHQVWDVIV